MHCTDVTEAIMHKMIRACNKNNFNTPPTARVTMFKMQLVVLNVCLVGLEAHVGRQRGVLY